MSPGMRMRQLPRYLYKTRTLIKLSHSTTLALAMAMARKAFAETRKSNQHHTKMDQNRPLPAWMVLFRPPAGLGARHMPGPAPRLDQHNLATCTQEAAVPLLHLKSTRCSW